MKVYVNRSPVNGPWGGGNLFVSAFHKRAQLTTSVELVANAFNAVPDVILMVGLDNDGTGISIDQAVMYKLYMNPNVKIVLRVNENDARKGTNHVDDMLLRVSEHLDGAVFVSNWLRDYFMEKGWACQNNAVIINGVAADVFAPQPKLNNGKVNIVAHHWSDNRRKGADIYEEIDRFVGESPDKYAFTYIGRHQCDFKHTRVIRPLAGKALGKELGKHDVYVSASRFDPGPNHITESISCGLPTYVHKDGGGCVEFAGQDHVYDDWEQLKQLFIVGKFEPNTTQFPPWIDCIKQYIDFLEKT